MEERTAIFLCGCAENIAGTIDLEALARVLEPLAGVGVVAIDPLLCSPEGKRFISDELTRHRCSRAVFAACSPKDHERDFREAVVAAGLNPYLLQVANIREHCTWVTTDRAEAQVKSLAMVRAALRRVQHHEAFEEREVECLGDVLVIGGGIAGMEAALLAAEEGRQVTIVEASPTLGGRIPQFEEVAPFLECGPCMVAPRLSAISEHPRVRVLTQAKVMEIVGFHGNFTAKVQVHPRRVERDLCLGCDDCMQACPVEVPNEFNHGMDRRKAIFIPYPGSVPNCATIDHAHCLRFQGQECTACATACPMEAVRFDQTDEQLEIRAGAVILATGFNTFDPVEVPGLGYGQLPEVYTLAEFERLCSQTGPTSGKIRRRDGEAPQRIVVIHCVGRDELRYCSGICCQAALKVAPALHHQGIHSTVTHLFRDLVAPGRGRATLRERAEQSGACFVRVRSVSSVRPAVQGSALEVAYLGAAGEAGVIEADMVLLAAGAIPNASALQLAAQLDLQRDPSGFLAPDHPVLRPAQSSLDGVYLAGCLSGPKTIPESIAQAQAAAGVALSRVQAGRKLAVETLTAQVKSAECSGCLICTTVCPYKACTRNEETGLAEIIDVLCRGCGTCVASCPSGAARARHFTSEQLLDEMKELLHV